MGPTFFCPSPTSGNSPSSVGKPDTVCNWLRTPTHFHIQRNIKFLLHDFLDGKTSSSNQPSVDELMTIFSQIFPPKWSIKFLLRDFWMGKPPVALRPLSMSQSVIPPKTIVFSPFWEKVGRRCFCPPAVRRCKFSRQELETWEKYKELKPVHCMYLKQCFSPNYSQTKGFTTFRYLGPPQLVVTLPPSL